MKRRIAVLLALGLLPWPVLHAQQTAQTTFKVTTKVQAVCQVHALDLDFGVYVAQAGGPGRLGSTQFQATCTPGTTYNVGLNEGTSPGATVTQRKMVSGTSTLDYQLYSDSARSVIWGNTPGTDTVPGTGTGLAFDHTIYGTLPGGQVIPAGNYVDTITLRVYY